MHVRTINKIKHLKAQSPIHLKTWCELSYTRRNITANAHPRTDMDQPNQIYFIGGRIPDKNTWVPDITNIYI
jgi:hypothetical protein